MSYREDSMPTLSLLATLLAATDFWAIAYPEVHRLPPLAMIQQWQRLQEDWATTIDKNIALAQSDAARAHWQGIKTELDRLTVLRKRLFKARNPLEEGCTRHMCLTLVKGTFPEAWRSGVWPAPIPVGASLAQ
jgi:hypothetical protein